MLIYSQNSRYYQCDDTDNISQQNLLYSNYEYDTTVVLSNEACRLDLVSLRVYNTPIYWWIIARFNSIINQDTAIAGTILKIPRLI
jgi:hypothetical protein